MGGHWKLNHVLKNIVISQVHMFLMFALFGYMYKLQVLYTAFGFVSEQPVVIGFMIILQFITAPYNAILDFAMTCLSRRFEFQADDFAFQLFKRTDKLRSALIKLNNDNLGYPIYDWLYSAWNPLIHPSSSAWRFSKLRTKKSSDSHRNFVFKCLFIHK